MNSTKKETWAIVKTNTKQRIQSIFLILEKNGVNIQRLKETVAYR